MLIYLCFGQEGPLCSSMDIAQDGAQHKTTVEFASLVLGEKYRTLTRKFDRMRRRRNIFTYDPADNLTERETLEALRTAKQFVKEIVKWIKERDPQLELF